MALTITSAGSGTSTSSGASVATGATITASIGDWLVALVAADNAGASGISSIGSVTDSQGNTWTDRATINFANIGANTGATLRFATCQVTVALASGTVSCSFSPNTTSKAIQVYRVQPGGGEAVAFRAVNTTGLTGSATSLTAPTVSVTSGDTIFGAAAPGTNLGVTGDSDTTNGSWSAVVTRLANTGSDGTSMTCSSQYKTVNATGNQAWAATISTARASARTYLIIGADLAAHALLAEDIQSTSNVTSPAVGQKHVLLATSIQSTSSVTSPAVGQKHGLLANDNQSTSEVSAPALEQGHTLLANDVQSTSEVSSPAIEQVHALLANDVQSASEVSSPALVENAPGVDNLFANDVQSLSQVSTPALTQVHILLANDVEADSEVSLPALEQVHILLANDNQSTSEVSSPTLVEVGAGVHALFADDIESASEVSSPALAIVGVAVPGGPGGGFHPGEIEEAVKRLRRARRKLQRRIPEFKKERERKEARAALKAVGEAIEAAAERQAGIAVLLQLQQAVAAAAAMRVGALLAELAMIRQLAEAAILAAAIAEDEEEVEMLALVA